MNDLLWHDHDAREARLRQIIGDRLLSEPPPTVAGQAVATYFLACRTRSLGAGADELANHGTTGVHHPPAGSLLAACTGEVLGVESFDDTGRVGLVTVAFPLKLMQQSDGRINSTDLLHLLAGAVMFDVYEHQDVRLVDLRLPPDILNTFPGPAYGPAGVRALTDWPAEEPCFGTILKPMAGITPAEVGALVAEMARCPLFLFIKEDENLFPNLDYTPVAQRTRLAIDALARAQDQRGGRGLIFAPHITGPPHQLLDTVDAVLAAGAGGVMFSESFANGAVRMVREATKQRPRPPVIYGHNGGIGVRSNASIWREVIDLLARLDGIDFRQTAPVRCGTPYIRPYGREWEASEAVLTGALPGAPAIKPTMIARAGALDQGNICLNLQDAARRGIADKVLFLAGSAINSIESTAGEIDPRLGAVAMQQAIAIHRCGELADVPSSDHVGALLRIAGQQGYAELITALRFRYPGAG